MSRFAKNLRLKKPRKSAKRHSAKRKSSASSARLRKKKTGSEQVCFSRVKLLPPQRK